jgi:hypothetical protein
VVGGLVVGGIGVLGWVVGAAVPSSMNEVERPDVVPLTVTVHVVPTSAGSHRTMRL